MRWPAASTGPVRPAGSLVAGLSLLLAFALKLYYSRAGVAELGFILQPTALFVELFTGCELSLEPAGFVSTELGLVVTPACAGVNFLVMALATLGLGQLGATLESRARWLWCVSLAPVAFLVTLLVNATRIVLVAHVGADHRALGVVLYVTALAGLHLAGLGVLGVVDARRFSCAV